MKFYLSSFKLGNETEKLKALLPNGRIGFVPNALDFTAADPNRRIAGILSRRTLKKRSSTAAKEKFHIEL
jgi:hypothetical protein